MTVEDFIYDLPKDEQVILKRLRALIFQAGPWIKEKLSYGVPYFSGHRRIFFLWPASAVACGEGVVPSLLVPKVTMGFCYGNLLSNEQGLLLSEGRKQVYTIKISSLVEIDEPTLIEVLNEAILVDAQFAKKRSNLNKYKVSYGKAAQV